MKKHYETHVEDTDKLISVAGPVLDYKSWYEQYRKLMEEQAQRKYGLYTPTSEGDDDDFPSIPGMIARYSASGLTNEQMKENPVWVDKTGNGHDLQMKNFLWGGMSGVGGYKLNWGDSSIWANYITQGTFGTGEVTDNTIHITSAKTNNALFETRASLKSVEYKVLIKGLTDDIYLHYGVFNDGKELWIEIKNDGIYTLPSYDYDSRYNMKWKVMSQTYPIDCNITIEQLPLYPGALVSDGVDDYGVCENFPILTKEKGYTVVVLRQWITTPNDNLFYGLMTNGNNRTDGAFVFEDFNRGSKSSFSFGGYTTVESGTLSMPFTYQTSTSYNGKAINIGSLEKGVDIFYVGRMGSRSYYVNAAVWEICILDHDATEEELQKIQDYYKQEYPWLFPDQAWTVTGKTNEDTDRATITNITGNGNDLVLSNFGFAEGSGYGLYAYNFNSFDLRDNVVKPTDVKKDSFRIIGTGNSGNVLVLSNTSNSAAWKIRITGMKEGDSCIVGNANKSGDYIKIIKDGIYTFQKQYAATSINGICYNSSQEVDVLVEQIPEYEGYLVTDGVDDKVQSSSFTMNEDWTIVGDWELLSNVQINCGIVKAQNVYLYNTANGLLISINNPRSLQSFGTKSLHAICSDGRLYDRNWVEYEYTADQNFKIVKSGLNIGFNLNNYAQIAFKNLGIYNNQILSKDDCIKAYNYLQTLKSK
jgi:hypothetical protein